MTEFEAPEGEIDGAFQCCCRGPRQSPQSSCITNLLSAGRGNVSNPCWVRKDEDELV